MLEYNLAEVWEDHCRCEFGADDIEGAMATMVAEPYVNHIPTMTGGVGYSEVKRFYRDHLIGAAPADFRLTPVSRTIGVDSLVDEMVCSFTHTCPIDWMLPGIPATGHLVEIPVVAIVKFNGGKVAHEHIYWDQASVLVQIGKLNPAGLPIAGVETARKVLNKALPSNGLMPHSN